MEQIPVTMLRETLDDIPQAPMPKGYHMRLHGPGDRETWIRVQRESEPFINITPNTFDSNFGDNLPALKRRAFFLVGPDGRDAGCITSWYKRYRGRRWGMIHWVCIVPDHRGKGLSKAIMTVAMNRLKALGHRRAMLDTQTARIPAIKTYLKFGFVPDMTAKRADEAWRIVREIVDHPTLAMLD